MKRVQLTMEKMFEVGRYLGTIEEKLKTEGPSYDMVAEWATKALGFEVSPTNLKTAAACAKVTWEIKQARRSSKVLTALKGRVGDLEHRLMEAEAQVAHLRGLVNHLYQQLDAKPPPGVSIPIAAPRIVNNSPARTTL